MSASPWIVSDELWEQIEPLLPRRERRFRYPGRRLLRTRLAAQQENFVSVHTGSSVRGREG
ncbi:transposase [Streptosporangium album]|uniref:Transposase n=1 Tax=Streptosporangium album TaxID=47479 RepID=A0A7W7WEE1_9ACTN|nr:hypothetical protein [Streptosporangium album]MBB4943274.1 transposase [Streptosporangium album]